MPRPGRFIPGKEKVGANFEGKISPSGFEPRTVQPLASRITDYTCSEMSNYRTEVVRTARADTSHTSWHVCLVRMFTWLSLQRLRRFRHTLILFIRFLDPSYLTKAALLYISSSSNFSQNILWDTNTYNRADHRQSVVPITSESYAKNGSSRFLTSFVNLLKRSGNFTYYQV
jgi:hypothetical protein